MKIKQLTCTLLLAFGLAANAANTVTKVGQVTGEVTLSDNVDYVVTDATPFAEGGKVNITNTDHAVLIIQNIRPSIVISSHLKGKVFINGAQAVAAQLEEIVGEIRDEYDEDEESLIQKVDDNTYLVPGGMKLDDINDALDTEFSSEDYDSIAGLVLQILDRMPTIGEEVTTEDGIRIKVETVHQNRITKVLLRLPEESVDVLEQN